MECFELLKKSVSEWCSIDSSFIIYDGTEDSYFIEDPDSILNETDIIK